MKSKKRDSKTVLASKKIVDSAQTALKEFFNNELKGIYWAETHLITIMPQIQAATTSKKLGTTIRDHLKMGKSQIDRLEQIFTLLGEILQGKKSKVIEGIIKEAESDIKNTEFGSTERDIGIILSLHKVGCYKIATYESIIRLSTSLGLNGITIILSETLAEEKRADQLLSDFTEKKMREGGEENE